MNNNFWPEFYKTERVKEPSPFAKWCNFFGQKVIEFGCGNGRDLTFFHRNGNGVVGIDPASPDLGELKLLRMDIKEFLKKYPNISEKDRNGIAYCRFLFHAIDEQEENLLLDWIKRNTQFLFAEMRSDKGVAPQDGHDRRLINADAFKAKIENLGMEILHFEENTGLAPFGDEDPIVIRVVAKTAKSKS